MTEWSGRIVESLGYGGVVFLMFLENVLPPIPSELIMPLAGFLAGQGKLSLAGVVAAGTAGSVLGALPLYALGRWLGQERLCRWAGRWGHWMAVSPDDIRHSAEWFGRHGGKAVFLCRLVPGVRSLVSVPAGAARMPLLPFLAYTAVGTAAWAGALAWLGRTLGQNYGRVQQYLAPVTYLVLAGLVVGFVIRAVRLRRGRARGTAGNEQACAAAAPAPGASPRA
jgi:membrane protein DedA with SNARE-associated domain